MKSTLFEIFFFFALYHIRFFCSQKRRNIQKRWFLIFEAKCTNSDNDETFSRIFSAIVNFCARETSQYSQLNNFFFLLKTWSRNTFSTYIKGLKNFVLSIIRRDDNLKIPCVYILQCVYILGTLSQWDKIRKKLQFI